MNMDCVTSSDEDEAPLTNGASTTRSVPDTTANTDKRITLPISAYSSSAISRSTARHSSTSSSDSDFDELLKATESLSDDEPNTALSEDNEPLSNRVSFNKEVNEDEPDHPYDSPPSGPPTPSSPPTQPSPQSAPPTPPTLHSDPPSPAKQLSESSSSSDSEPETPAQPQQASQNHLSRLQAFLKASKPTVEKLPERSPTRLNGFSVPNIPLPPTVPPPPVSSKLENPPISKLETPPVAKLETPPLTNGMSPHVIAHTPKYSPKRELAPRGEPKVFVSKAHRKFLPKHRSPPQRVVPAAPPPSDPIRSSQEDPDSDDSLSSMEDELTNALALDIAAPLEPGQFVSQEFVKDNHTTLPAILPIKSEISSFGDDILASLERKSHSIKEEKVELGVDLTPAIPNIDLGALALTTSEAPTAGVDLGALMFQVAEKGDESHSELFAAIADQPAQLEDLVPFHAPALPDTSQPSEAEIDCVLGEIYDSSMIGSLPPVKTEHPADSLLGDIYNNTLNLAMKPEYPTKPSPVRDYSPSPGRNYSPVRSPQRVMSPQREMAPRGSPKIVKSKSSKSWKSNNEDDSWHQAEPETSMFSTFLSPSKKGRKKKAPVSPVSPVREESAPYSEVRDDMFAGFSSAIKKTKSSKKSTPKPRKNQFSCTQCTRTFKEQSKLDYHINFTHPESMGFACDMCQESFESAIELQCHQLCCGQESE